MTRMDPSQLLQTLHQLLSKDGGVKSKAEVDRLIFLMHRYSKKLVSKIIYTKILGATSREILEYFILNNGLVPLNAWLLEAASHTNWPLCTEIVLTLKNFPVGSSRLIQNKHVVSTLNLLEDLGSDESADDSVKFLAVKVCSSWMQVLDDRVPPRIPPLTPDLTSTQSQGQIHKELSENFSASQSVFSQLAPSLIISSSTSLCCSIDENHVLAPARVFSLAETMSLDDGASADSSWSLTTKAVFPKETLKASNVSKTSENHSTSPATQADASKFTDVPSLAPTTKSATTVVSSVVPAAASTEGSSPVQVPTDGAAIAVLPSAPSDTRATAPAATNVSPRVSSPAVVSTTVAVPPVVSAAMALTAAALAPVVEFNLAPVPPIAASAPTAVLAPDDVITSESTTPVDQDATLDDVAQTTNTLTTVATAPLTDETFINNDLKKLTDLSEANCILEHIPVSLSNTLTSLPQVKSEDNSLEIDNQPPVTFGGSGEKRRSRKRSRSSLGEHKDFQPRPKRSRYCVKKDTKLCYVVFADECYVEEINDHQRSDIDDVWAEGAAKSTLTVNVKKLDVSEHSRPAKLFKNYEKLNIFLEVADSMRKEKMLKAVQVKHRRGRGSSRGDSGPGRLDSSPEGSGGLIRGKDDSLNKNSSERKTSKVLKKKKKKEPRSFRENTKKKFPENEVDIEVKRMKKAEDVEKEEQEKIRKRKQIKEEREKIVQDRKDRHKLSFSKSEIQDSLDEEDKQRIKLKAEEMKTEASKPLFMPFVDDSTSSIDMEPSKNLVKPRASILRNKNQDLLDFLIQDESKTATSNNTNMMSPCSTFKESESFVLPEQKTTEEQILNGSSVVSKQIEYSSEYKRETEDHEEKKVEIKEGENCLMAANINTDGSTSSLDMKTSKCVVKPRVSILRNKNQDILRKDENKTTLTTTKKFKPAVFPKKTTAEQVHDGYSVVSKLIKNSSEESRETENRKENSVIKEERKIERKEGESSLLADNINADLSIAKEEKRGSFARDMNENFPSQLEKKNSNAKENTKVRKELSTIDIRKRLQIPSLQRVKKPKPESVPMTLGECSQSFPNSLDTFSVGDKKLIKKEKCISSVVVGNLHCNNNLSEESNVEPCDQLLKEEVLNSVSDSDERVGDRIVVGNLVVQRGGGKVNKTNIRWRTDEQLVEVNYFESEQTQHSELFAERRKTESEQKPQQSEHFAEKRKAETEREKTTVRGRSGWPGLVLLNLSGCRLAEVKVGGKSWERETQARRESSTLPSVGSLSDPSEPDSSNRSQMMLGARGTWVSLPLEDMTGEGVVRDHSRQEWPVTGNVQRFIVAQSEGNPSRPKSIHLPSGRGRSAPARPAATEAAGTWGGGSRVGSKPCKFWTSKFGCKFGSKCRFLHAHR